MAAIGERDGDDDRDARPRWIEDPVAVLDRAVVALAGEAREGQRVLAEAVSDALRAGHHLVAEAPTGSGKSLAYLAPAVASGMRVVVATSTRTLQAQLVGKDLPLLEQHAGVPFEYALLKGRANYLCRAKLRAADAPDALFEVAPPAAFGRHLESLRAFAVSSPTGDRSELDDDVPDASWAAVSCSSAECPGRQQCADGANCFAELARERAREADVLVVNHALYCTHLAAGGGVLPEHDAVVIDEAHAFADGATNTFGVDLVADGLKRLATVLARAGGDLKRVDAVHRAADALDTLLLGRDGRIDLGADTVLATALHTAAESVASAGATIAKSDHDGAPRAQQLAGGRLEALRRFGEPGADDVVWVDRSRRSPRLCLAPVAVGDRLAATMFERQPVIAVSATLGGASPFREFAGKIGLDPRAKVGTSCGYEPLQAPSSFAWREQGMLYVGRDLPDPGRDRDRWMEESGARLVRLVEAAGGRTLVLCTSRANVARFADLLREHSSHEVLAQGDADTGRLTRSFVENETSVLVGTRSFWAGIDAPGTACVLVVIDRIPFPQPTDPLHAARRDRAVGNGLDAFAAVDLPEAALVLAQGAGRLLRRREDRGVVAVLDSRLATRSYRTALLAAMPPLRRSIDLDAVCAFLAEAAASPVKEPAQE